jgi:hypothetical protein
MEAFPQFVHHVANRRARGDLDARYLSGSGVLLEAPHTNDDWISYRTVRMVPASNCSVQQGSGEVAKFSFKVGIDVCCACSLLRCRSEPEW